MNHINSSLRLLLTVMCTVGMFERQIIAQEYEIVGGYKWGYEGHQSSAAVVSVSPQTGDIVVPTSLGSCTVDVLYPPGFKGCSKITSIIVPHGVSHIAENMFAGCTSLTNLVLPASAVEMNNNVFDGCVNLRNVELPGNVYIEGWGSTMYRYFAREAAGVLLSTVTDLSIAPGSVTVNQSYFMDGLSLKKVSIPGSVTNIGNEAFCRCMNLTGVNLSEGLEEIGACAFYGCGALTDVSIPKSVKRLNQAVFKDCHNLTNITFYGDAPYCPYSIFEGINKQLVIRVPKGSKGWDGNPESTALPKLWPHNTNDGRPIIHIGDELPAAEPVVTNYVMVTNYVYTTVTNVVEHWVTNMVYTTVTNVVKYVPEVGTAPAEVYSVKAGGEAASVIAGAAGWDAMGVPEGMTWDRETGTLGGVPVRSGSYDLILVSGSGVDTKMMRTVVTVAGFEPIVGYVGTAFAWKGAPMTMLDNYKNLPAGLKWSEAAGTLAGVPTKAGDFSRTTTYGDQVEWVVKELPATAIGTFNGEVALGGTNYPVVVTTTKAGKLTAKIGVGTKTLSLSATSWGGWAKGEHLLFRATLATKTDSLELMLDADQAWNTDQVTMTVVGGALAGATGTAQRNGFATDEAAKAAAESAAGTYTLDVELAEGGYVLVPPVGGKVGAMSVVLKANGAATLKGKIDAKTTVSAAGTLHVDEEGKRELVFFFKGDRYVWAW